MGSPRRRAPRDPRAGRAAEAVPAQPCEEGRCPTTMHAASSSAAQRSRRRHGSCSSSLEAPIAGTSDGPRDEPGGRRDPRPFVGSFDGGLHLLAVQAHQPVLQLGGHRPRQAGAQHREVVDGGHERRHERGAPREQLAGGRQRPTRLERTVVTHEHRLGDARWTSHRRGDQHGPVRVSEQSTEQTGRRRCAAVRPHDDQGGVADSVPARGPPRRNVRARPPRRPSGRRPPPWPAGVRLCRHRPRAASAARARRPRAAARSRVPAHRMARSA